MALNVKDCGFLGDYLYVTANRDTLPPLGTAGGSSSAGFTYSGSSITDTETAPLYYKVFITGANGSINLEGLPSSLDLRGITNKDNFTLPMDISIHKAPRSHVHPSLYTGSYTGNFTYSITYQ